MSEQVSPKPTLTRLVLSSQRLASSRTALEREPGDLCDPFLLSYPSHHLRTSFHPAAPHTPAWAWAGAGLQGRKLFPQEVVFASQVVCCPLSRK